MSTPNWPIRVGGVYLLRDREPLAMRVLAIDGEDIYYIHHVSKESRYYKIGEFGSGVMSDYAFRYQTLPEDQSPIPALVSALEQSVACIQEDRDVLERSSVPDPTIDEVKCLGKYDLVLQQARATLALAKKGEVTK